MLLKPYGKINIGLNIVGVDEEGYHLLDMVMAPISLSDTIRMDVIDSNQDKIIFSNNDIDVGNNTIIKAINLLRNKYGFSNHFKVKIKKRIPMQAGLGGGSADAAYVMRAINVMLGLNIDKEELKKLALQIGADVPFFIDSGAKRCQGRGERLSTIRIKHNYHVLLIKPKSGCDTKLVYQTYDKLDKINVDIDGIIKALELGDDYELKEKIDNALLLAASKQCSDVTVILDDIKKYNVVASMSGSGSVIYALSTNKGLLKKINKKYKKKYHTYLCKLWR